MRKKTIVWAYLVILSLGTILSLYIPKNEVAAKDAVVIPGQAIRLRILANSDLDSDQALKRKVRDAVNAKISVWVQDLTSITQARKVIKSKLPEIEATAEETVKEEGSTQKVKVKFGEVQFPTKLYGQFLYPAGDYEAILITLGKGEGANWWCVLFPPLCFLDFSNGIAVSNGFDEKKQGNDTAEKQAAATPKPSVKEGVSPDPVPSNPEKQVDPAVKTTENEQADASPDPVPTKSVKQVDPAVKTTENEQADVSPDPVPSKSVKQAKTAEKSAAAKKVKKKETSTKQAPVYTAQDEEPVKVKFFVVELWDKIF